MEFIAQGKSYEISKRVVWDAYKRVKANRGVAGVDQQSLADFKTDLKGDLYKIWNRMSLGSYFPPTVRLVEIPKGQGGTTPLGIPTIADRIAQMVVKVYLEPLLEPDFHSPGGAGAIYQTTIRGTRASHSKARRAGYNAARRFCQTPAHLPLVAKRFDRYAMRSTNMRGTPLPLLRTHAENLHFMAT